MPKITKTMTDLLKYRPPFDLDDQSIQHMKHWKYTVDDKSITLPYLNRFWTFVVNTFIPEYVSPNLLTFCGLCVTLVMWLLVELTYDHWMIFPIIISYWIASTFDGIDGIQARRTQTATALGELFDHMVDLVTLFVITRISFHVFGALHIDGVSTFALVGIVFCSSHYFACLTGRLYIGKYSGPNECLLVLSALYTIRYLTKLMNVYEYLSYFEVMSLETYLNFVSLFVLFWAAVFVCVHYLTILINYSDSDNEIVKKNIRFYDNCVAPLLVFYFARLFIYVVGYDAPLYIIQVVCFCLIVNCELIVIKMAQIKFRLEAFLFSIGCLIHWFLALFLVVYSVSKTVYAIKTGLRLHWLKSNSP